MDSENDLSSTVLPAGNGQENANFKTVSFDKALDAGTKELTQKLKKPAKKGRPADSPEVKEQKRLERNARRRKGSKPLESNFKTNEYGAPPESNVFESAGDPHTPAEPLPEMDFKPFLRQGLNMPFKMWAGKTGCADLELTEKELEAPAEYANQLLNYYAPKMESMDPGKTAAVMFAISMLMLVGEKNAVLEKHRSAINVTAQNVSQEKPAPAQNNQQPVTSAMPPVDFGGR